ncbi:MAG: zinc ribbon domain-containing protein [Verrucomicrobiales bacterium]|jgi:putative FmdB family regulatory protein|nr:zinc ribbon domain-containing protein [Verrucomicrobiales bacterium]MDR1304623.1 zinc ribbon domain-containing protein [Verrucomicrobiales bacterium]
MPIYSYELIAGECKICGGQFDLRRPLDRPALTDCPLCRKPVRKVVAQVNTPKLLKPIAPSAAKNAGFKIYQKRDQGVYEAL